MPRKIRFFYDMGRELRCASIRLDNNEAEMDDIVPLIAARLSTLLARRIAPTCICLWKLNEPQRVYRNVSTIAPLEDIATMVEMNGAVAPYVSRDKEPVSLVVQLLPPFPRLGKRPLEGAGSDVVEVVKRAKIATMSPSSLAQPQTFRTLHRKPEEPILDHRHVDDPEDPSDFLDNLPPISIHYKGFGVFLDIFRGARDVRGLEFVSSLSSRRAVDEFAERMSLIYENEQVREDEGLDALNDIFSSRTDDFPLVLMEANGSNSSDSKGHFLGPHQAAYCVVSFKNELGCGSAIPYVEMTGHFAHSMREAAEYTNPALVMRGWNFPCLGLSITGHTITFYAIIFARQWRVVSLTPGLSCIRASGDGDDRTALYNAFEAASVLLAHIQGEATELIHNPPPPIEESCRTLPPISSLRHPHFRTRIEFKIVEFFHDRAPNRYLYSAQTTGGKQIIVKFARRYSYELHMFCADRGYAPTLLGFERLPGGFFCVAMEFFQSAFSISHTPNIEQHREWADELQELVESFHAEGLVHGDLRAPNIICDRNRVMLVDFDLGGKEGEVSYPDGPLNFDLTIGRVRIDRMITKDDDLRILKRTLKSARLK